MLIHSCGTPCILQQGDVAVRAADKNGGMTRFTQDVQTVSLKWC